MSRSAALETSVQETPGPGLLLRAAVLVPLWAAFAIGVVIMIAALPGDDDPGGCLFALWIMAAILVSPTSWFYYLVLLAIPMMKLSAEAANDRTSRRALWAGVATYTLAWLYFTAVDMHSHELALHTNTLVWRAGVPAAGDQLKAYLANHGVDALIVGPRRQYRVGSIDRRRSATTWLRWPTLAPERDATYAMLGSLVVPAIEAAGVRLYELTPQTLAPYRNLTALAMEQRAEEARFEALLFGAERYLAAGGDPASLSPALAQKLGLLPDGWFGGTLLSTGDSNPIFHSDVVLGPAQPGGIAVGIEGWYYALEPIIRTCSADASRTYFPYPKLLEAGSVPRGPAMMVMTFDRARLARASVSAACCGGSQHYGRQRDRRPAERSRFRRRGMKETSV